MEREKHGKEHRDNGTKREERYRETQRDRTDHMGQMERGHTAEVQPDCMTEAYTVGISETHIRNNATVFRVWQMIERGELTREEGLYLMVNTLADENHRLNQMCNDLIMRMPSRLLVETITVKN